MLFASAPKPLIAGARGKHMGRRKPLTMVEMMIIVAILGILAAIALPGLQQAKMRARAGAPPGAARPAAPAQVPSDGQLNTIDLADAERPSADRSSDLFGRLIAPLRPIAITVIAFLILMSAIRRQKSRRA